MSALEGELAVRWLKKATNDIVTAQQTLLLADGPTDTVGFHAQQAAEKALKAFLAFHGIQFPRSHDLLRIADLAAPHLSAILRHREELAEMTNYAVQARYPEEWPEPSREDVIRSLRTAAEIVEIVKEHITS
jgi:HEPN domain-containing protein